MKTRGWILTVICSMLLLVAGITFASMVLVGQPALANESLWWWILINLGVMVLLFGYGVKRGIRYCVSSAYRKANWHGNQVSWFVIIISAWKSMLCINCGTSVISVFLCCLSFIFVLHCVQGTILFPKSKACSARCWFGSCVLSISWLCCLSD